MTCNNKFYVQDKWLLNFKHDYMPVRSFSTNVKIKRQLIGQKTFKENKN